MQSLPAYPSLELQAWFIILAIAVVFVVTWAARSIQLLGFASAWLLLTGALASIGWFADFSAFPPRAPLLLGGTIVLLALVSVSSPGKRLAELPIEWLIGFQSFRVLVEIAIHQAVVEGVAPVQLSWDGLNFDIVTGVSALVMMPLAKYCPRWLLLAWNKMGLMLVLSVVVVAVLSLPTPIQMLRPDNVWIAIFPFVWLPSILVFAALLGHIVLYRKLSRMRGNGFT